MKQWAEHRSVFSGEDHVHPDCLQRGYVWGLFSIVSFWSQKDKNYAVNDCNTIEFW
jgi:hypothetical protein